MIKETEDRNLVKDRILKMINDQPNGLLIKDRASDAYKSTYNESLPVDWLKTVENLVVCETQATNVTILRPVRASNKTDNEPKSLNIESLNINDMDGFWMRIFVVNSTKDVRGVIIDENHYVRIN